MDQHDSIIFVHWASAVLCTKRSKLWTLVFHSNNKMRKAAFSKQFNPLTTTPAKTGCNRLWSLQYLGGHHFKAKNMDLIINWCSSKKSCRPCMHKIIMTWWIQLELRILKTQGSFVCEMEGKNFIWAFCWLELIKIFHFPHCLGQTFPSVTQTTRKHTKVKIKKAEVKKTILVRLAGSF